MGAFNASLLPHDLRSLYESDPTFREWVHLTDKVRRAEKVSCWTQWTSPQHAAYEAGDLLHFSLLRGYTAAEIAEFSRSMALVVELDGRHGDDFCLNVEFVLGQLVETEELRAINQELCRMSEAA
jgi:hypothetical protein